MSRQSKETAARDRAVRAAKAKYREDFRTEHGYLFCEGCEVNQSVDRLDISHSVGLGKNTTIAALPENFALLCRNKCHRRVEAGDIEGMNCEEKLREIIERHAPISLGGKKHEAAIAKIYRDNPAA